MRCSVSHGSPESFPTFLCIQFYEEDIFLVHIKRIQSRITTGQIAPRISASWAVSGATIQVSQNSSVLYILSSGSQGSTSLTNRPHIKIPPRCPPNQASSYSRGSSMGLFPHIKYVLGSTFQTPV